MACATVKNRAIISKMETVVSNVKTRFVSPVIIMVIVCNVKNHSCSEILQFHFGSNMACATNQLSV